jgi:tRNA threonylcarbamoyladenosine biosynthesis protein TsaE
MIVTTSPSQTLVAGELLGRLAQPGDVIALTGGLGAGKTALTQGIASGLGTVGHVPSPTFNILLVHRALLTLNHFDLYRLDTADQLVDIDFYATLESGGVSVIEWADRFPAELPDDRLEVAIETTGDSERTLRVTGFGPASRERAQAWVSAWNGRGGERP